MAVEWKAYNLAGARDGSNRTFTLAVIPDPRATRILYNGDVLFRVGSNPAPTQYAIAGNNILLGEAPGAGDSVWAVLAEATAVITASMVEIRPDFYFNVELRSSAGVLKEVFQKDIEDIYWVYSAAQGCVICEIALARLFDDYGDIQVDDQVFVWRQLNPLGSAGAPLPAQLPMSLGTSLQGAQELRWSGIVREVQPIFNLTESVRLVCSGFAHQLGRIVVPETQYQNMDVGAVIRHIVDTFVIPGSAIMRTADLGLVPDVGQFVTDMTFDTTAFEAIRALAEFGGNLEWGVRADKEFFCVNRSTVIRQTYNVGKEIDLYVAPINGDDEVNRVYVRGANGYRTTLNLDPFQPGNQKERVVSLPFISSDEDATLWGAAYKAVHRKGQRRGQLKLNATDRWIENPQGRIAAADHPLGVLRVSGAPRFVKGGEPLPDQLPMALAETIGAFTDHQFRVNAVRYTPTKNALNIDLDLGERGRAGDRFLLIERKLSELRQLAV